MKKSIPPNKIKGSAGSVPSPHVSPPRMMDVDIEAGKLVTVSGKLTYSGTVAGTLAAGDITPAGDPQTKPITITGNGSVTVATTSKLTKDSFGCADGYKVIETANDLTKTFTVKAIELVTLTLTKDEGVKTLTATNEAGAVFSDGAKFDKDDAVKLYACYELNETGVVLDEANSVLEVTMDADQTIKVVTKPLAAPYPEWVPEDDEVKGKYDQWKTKTCPAEDTQLTELADLQDAFLLNCDPGVNALAAAKAAFKVTSITQDASGNWIVKVTNEKGQNETYGNGYVNIISVKEDLFKGAGAGSDFFKATLTFKPTVKQAAE